LTLVAAGGWYFARLLPEQRRFEAEQQKVEQAKAEARGGVRAKETARAHAMLEKFHGPEPRQRWTIPELGLELVPIAAGTFTMGSPASEQGRFDDEGPQPRVTLSKGYWLGKTEVTQREWQAVMGNTPSNFKGDNLPVEQVSWTEAMEFCRKLTERERAAGRLPEGYAYTLPTEAQWEYACRAGTSGDYAGNLDEMGWYGQNSGNKTHPVGQKKANGWGLHDMHGNVWEWCADWYGNYPGGSVTDPKGPVSGSGRVNRGGGWVYSAQDCRSAVRGRSGPGNRSKNLGFRLALAPSP
jgi:formylglycine-generating enzyme required for sulfatase activity